MPTKKYKQKLMKHHICVAARMIACVAFLVLTVIGVSSLVRAMSLDAVEHQNGIPSAWKIASLGQPETITVPITYWDQRQDACGAPNRQFEWSECILYAKGIIPNVVKDKLGSDGLPVPTYNNSNDAWAAYHDVFTMNVIGNDPVLPTDNFYRWFHETYDENGKQLSKQYDREVVFRKVEGTTNSYTYGSHGTFPLDDVDFSNDDNATNSGHNFHFTAHLQIPMKIATDGTEEFHFLGDDDVWVFLNGQLVLDLGGLHMETAGSFRIDQNGNVQSTVENVNLDQACRQKIADPSLVGNSIYNAQLENNCKRGTKTTTIYTGFKPGDVVNLDFFYAERSTTESNTTITITNMNWPISADSNIDGKIVGKLEDSDSNLVEYITSITNRDPLSPLKLNRIATYVSDTGKNEDGVDDYQNAGFLPHTSKTLYYTATPEDDSSWQPVEISAPMSNEAGFTLTTPLTMSSSGQAGDTLYFRFYAETSDSPTGTIYNRTSYYTELDGVAGVTYDNVSIDYTGKQPVEEPDPVRLTINYIIDWQGEDPDPEIEQQLPPTYEKELPAGDPYNVPTPTIDGFTPDHAIVSGIMTDEDLTITVIYTKDIEEKPTYKVHITYIRSDTGEPIFPEYNAEHKEGDEIKIYPEDAEGFTKDTELIEFTVSGDTEIVVLYTPMPENPDDDPIVPPFGPTTPTDPDDEDDLPIIPILPGEDDDLVYLPPLGEVVYVPNTGVISEYVAPIFDQYFASVILSQGFVLITLLIFSGSFATYFSLRQYLNLSTSTRNAVTTKKMPKNVANSKTARNMQKAAQKTNKKSTKVTTSAKKTASRKTKK